MKKIKIKTINKGFAYAHVHVLRSGFNVEKNIISNIDAEISKFDEVISKLKIDLEGRISSNNMNIDIIKAHREMLDDPNIISNIKEYIKTEKVNIEYAVQFVTNKMSSDFKNLDNGYLKARADDIIGLGKLIVDKARNHNETLNNKSILVTRNLTPNELIMLDESMINGIITNEANPTSHTAIISKNLDIPFVFEENLDIESLRDKEVIIDTEDESIIIDPENTDVVRIQEKNKKYREEKEKNVKQNKLLDNQHLKTKIYANISNISDVNTALENGAVGVGLYRTEFLYMNRDKAPTEDEQFENYKTILEKMGDREVIIRTIDIGTDKKVSYLDLPNEENPQLGLRGIRVSLSNVDLCRTQLRALLRASIYGNESIMLPMITSEKEVLEMKKLIDDVIKDLKNNNIEVKMPKIGIMIETPAAALISDKLSKIVDFFSIGTNDLTQYVIALDRNGKGLSKYYDMHHEGVYRLIDMVTKNAHKSGINVGVCGALASDDDGIKKLISIGVDELSVIPSMAANIRKQVYDIENKKTNDDDEIFAVVDGEYIDMKDIGDSTFSQGMLGKCFGIVPTDNNIYAPFDCEIVNIAKTKHAITLKNIKGKEYLIHIGIDTVNLHGDYFDIKVSIGDNVKKNTLLANVDFAKIKSKGYDPTVVFIELK